MTDRLVGLDVVAEVYSRPVAEIRTSARNWTCFIHEDWAGHPAITEDDARAQVSGNARVPEKSGPSPSRPGVRGIAVRKSHRE
jgi:hypothetical protein